MANIIYTPTLQAPVTLSNPTGELDIVSHAQGSAGETPIAPSVGAVLSAGNSSFLGSGVPAASALLTQVAGSQPQVTRGNAVRANVGTLSLISNAPTVEGSAVRGSIKFTPGHWILLSSGSGGGGLSGWTNRINQVGAINAAAGFKVFVGILIPLNWNGMEFSEGVYTKGSGATAQGLAFIAQLVSACTNNGLKCGIEYEDRTFFAHTYTTPSASLVNLPSYFDTLNSGGRGYYIAPSGTTVGGLGGIALEDQPYVLDRHIALATAYATTPLPDGSTLETNPTFEMWRGPETAIAGGTGISNNRWEANIKAWYAALRSPSCFQTTEISISTNFFGSVTLMQDLFANGAAPNAGAVGGPDNNIPYASDLSYGKTDAAKAYTGDSGPSWVDVLCWISESQFPDSTANSKGATCVDVWNFWTNNISKFNPSPTWGGVKPHKYVWFDNTGSTGITIAQIVAAIKAGQMPVNTTVPSSYL